MRRKSVFAAAILSAFVVLGAAHAEDRKPNILVIVADDMGYADCGFHGCSDIPTPNIDSLAAHGVRFSRGYVSGPYCSPTRAGLLTGRYQQRFGHEFNPARQRGGVATDRGLPLAETTMADRLKENGYATGLVGKWHLGDASKFHPMRRGFGEFYGFLEGAHSYFPESGAPILRGHTPVAKPEYLTDAFAREAASFIDRHASSPFFLYLAFNAVHTPMQALQARKERFASIKDDRRRTYAAMLSSMDDAVGQVLEKIRAARLEENTLIFFFSDNGGPTMRGTTINGSRNHPLRGSKRTTLEGGIRVPFVVQWRKKLPQGVVYRHPIIQLDVLPTVLAASGAPVGSQSSIDGVNLLPYLTGQEKGAPHGVLYWRLGKQSAVIQGDWKLVAYDPLADGRSTESPINKRLYNLADDAGETRDLAAERPELAASLDEQWRRWSDQMAPPLWGPESQQ